MNQKVHSKDFSINENKQKQIIKGDPQSVKKCTSEPNEPSLHPLDPPPRLRQRGCLVTMPYLRKQKTYS